ncbi:hypothetical protein BP00DRAFT_461225 [Aspergillus indologenus CBS 114.80]|uniref:RING-type domain-containing protein n=1 Tax=Aspergillus indologenus CBS 114.80 TaxID=1450541 RepID=A0A2V5HVQ7_9EURO|nr:hypothetical protein BP00DRAFT_461225 [Aspergillus indologenus CBS 114.80]
MSRYPAKADHLSEILDLYPDEERWCAGYAPSEGRRCHNPISGANRGSAVRLLDEGSERMIQGEDIHDLLMDLASLVLCRHVHQKDRRSQVPSLVRKWQEKIRGVSEDLEKGEGVIGRSAWRYHHNLFTACSIDHGAAWAIHCSSTDPSCFYLILTFRLSIFRLFASKAFTSTSFNFKLFPHYLHPDGQPPCYCYSSFQLSRLSDYFDVGVYISFYVHCIFHHLTYKRQSKSKSTQHSAQASHSDTTTTTSTATTTTTSVTSTRTITVSTSSSTSTAAPTASAASPRVSVSNVEPEASAIGPTDATARPRTASTTVTPAASTSAPTTLASTSTTIATAGASSTSDPTSAPTTAPTVPAQTATATATATPEPTTTTSQPDTSSPAVVSQPSRSSSSSSPISSPASAVSVPSPLVPKPAYTPTRQPITGDCAICYEPLLPDSPFTTPHQAARDLSIVHCKQQCGTNFHFSCMFTWKKTASQMDRQPTCPMCRAAWS